MLSELFTTWKSTEPHKTNGNFIDDGIIDQNWWNACQTKVLFILREAYDLDPNSHGFNLCEYVQEHKYPGQTWTKLGHWAYLLQNLQNDKRKEFDNRLHADLYREALLSSAVMNIKKSGGKKHTDMKEIIQLAQHDQVFLSQEIELIDPDIILCGGVYGSIKHIWENQSAFKHLTKRVHSWGNRLIIDYWHPATQWPYEILYYGLMGMLDKM